MVGHFGSRDSPRLSRGHLQRDSGLRLLRVTSRILSQQEGTKTTHDRGAAALQSQSPVVVTLLIMLPNILWQIQHQFVSLAYLRSIHARDFARGATDFFLLNQFWKPANPVALPLWLAGLWYLFVRPEGKRYRILGWTYLITLVALLVAKGRDYYLAPAYPILIAAGAVWGEQWLSSSSAGSAANVLRVMWISLLTATLCTSALTLPIAPLNSAWWRVANNVNGNFAMEVGWPCHQSLRHREQLTGGLG